MVVDFNDNREAKDVLRIINHGTDNVFLTGKAGTGKTTLLQTLVHGLKKKFVVLAPTGSTALNAGGKTIHSFFQFGFAPILPAQPVNHQFNTEKRELIRALDVLIIDEISMVRADLIDGIERTLQYYRGNDQPFGGIQLLLVGDSFQLPPVITRKDWQMLKYSYKSVFFFDALAFRSASLLTIELLKVYRQQDAGFLELLEAIRKNKLTDEHLRKLNARVIGPNSMDLPLTIVTLKTTVEQINKTAQEKLPGASKDYQGITHGIFTDANKPTLDILTLKIGAKVIFVKNDPSGRWVNGTIGEIVDMNDTTINVILPSEEVLFVEPVTWSNMDYQYNHSNKTVITKEIGSFNQLPIALCWAVTIHKSQGLTFDSVVVDLGSGAWQSGQTYVALSRCRIFEGLYLIRPITRSDICLDPAIIEFAGNFNNEAVYHSAVKATRTNQVALLEEIEIFKEQKNYERIIKNIDLVLSLSVNLVHSFSLLTLKGYCAARVGNEELTILTEEEMGKYSTLKRSIGSMNYDSSFSLIHSATLLNDPETSSRGYHKFNMLFSITIPETEEYLTRIAFDQDFIHEQYSS